MPRCLFSLVVTALMFVAACPPVMSQTLTKRLRSEDVVKLARDARERGDAVRGALLFQKQKIDCAKCHTSGAGQSPIGPNLSRPEQDASDAHVVESILDPSTKIRQGFEQVNVETELGRILSGQVVEKTPQKLLLRDPATEKVHTIDVNDVAEIRTIKKSAMPDGLADQLADRQQFLDLVKYVLDLGDGGSDTSAPIGKAVARKPLHPDLHGRFLLGEYNCVSCHQQGAAGERLWKKQAPNLDWSAGRIDPHYVARFIVDPHRVKPGTTMPDMLAKLKPAEKLETATSIAHYLASRSNRTFEWQLIDEAAAKNGRELFHTIGCVACHSPRDEQGVELLVAEPDNVPLGRLEAKYSLNSLMEFLNNPHAVRPSGRMPKVPMTHWETRDIASYLLFDTDVAAAHMRFQIDPNLVAIGKREFETRGCIECHGGEERALATRSFKTLTTLNADRGCLSEDVGDWPHFQLSAAKRSALSAAIPVAEQELSKPDRIDLSLATHNCIACHQRGSLGGVGQTRSAYFHTTNENLGEQGRLPPTLTGVGAKLKPQWFRDVLLNEKTIRPYMKTRMPQYGEENVGHLIELLEQQDKLPAVVISEPADAKQFKQTGRSMVGNDGLNCIACHTYKLKKSDLMPAVDLTEMADRLQPNWFHHYMRDPQRFSPNTVMPSFWPGGRAMRKEILAGDTDQQIAALWTYLLDGRQAGTPRGLIREPIQLVVKDEAVMLRRNYGGIGKRGIGVGYPLGVNLAYDAEQMRVGMIWKGQFADPGGVYFGQGSGSVRPLGTDRIEFTKGPEFDSATEPWVADKESRPPKHLFKGYYLDKLRRPTFMHHYDGIAVEDYWQDVKDSRSGTTIFRRTLTFNTEKPRDDVSFRAAQGVTVVAEENNTFLVGKSLRVRVVGDQPTKVESAGDAKSLLIPLKLPTGKTTITLEYQW